ncbi:acyltransferase family protein [Streptomyces sp. NPDC048172]|uniref:acyltransferase family protein n=1 Tax=Streptomyces sp. NPDC048172 TaxID=3365505 RepID=UPI0037194285
MATEIADRAGPGSVPAPPDRDAFLDNAKFLLIVLVVVGHVWPLALVEAVRPAKAGYLWITAFHMPAFVLLCGYLSRGFTGRPDQVRRLLAGVLAPYLVFETLYTALDSAARDRPFALTPTEPTFLCWFLAALFVWRLTAPVWRAVPYPVPVAVLISLAAGTTTLGYDLALPRVLMFLPWFVLGLRLRPEHLARLREPRVRRWAPLVLLGAAVGAYAFAPGTNLHWTWMSSGYEGLGAGPVRYLLVRVALFAIGAAMTAAFLALVPGRRTWFTALGAVTLYPYLLHGLLTSAASAYGWHAPLLPWDLSGAVLLTVLGAALAVLLSSAPVRRLARPLVEPPLPGLTGRTERSGKSDQPGTSEPRTA